MQFESMTNLQSLFFMQIFWLTFAPDFKKTSKMTGFGLIGAGAALLNYRKVKANLEEVEELRDTIITGLKTYQQYMEELNEWQQEIKLQAELDAIKVDEVNNPDGLQVTTILRVANLVGRYYKAKISVLFSNTTKDQVFQIEEISSTCYFENQVIASEDYVYLTADEVKNSMPYILVFTKEMYEKWKRQNALDTILINPGQTVERGFDTQTYKIPELAEKMRDYITEYCGTRLITSCLKVSIDNKIENANIMFTWRNAKSGDYALDSEKYKTAQYRAKPGVLRYCGEGGLK